MVEERFRDVQARWAGLLLSSLADAGVRDVVVSPGSRSTPFLLAALADERLRCHDVVDERSAAFFALGLSRVGRGVGSAPPLLLCTSGSAGAHYYPAVLEAEADHLPLLVLTADRPPERIGNASNQTLDQTHLYGGHVRFFADLAVADPEPRASRGLRRIVAQAVHAAVDGPGPVHLNARARKPLEPSAVLWVDPAPPAPPLARISSPPKAPDPEALAELADLAASTERGLLVAGPAHLDQMGARDAVSSLARRLGWPLLADATSQVRSAAALAAHDTVLRADAWTAAHRPDVILQIGRGPAGSAWTRFVTESVAAGARHWVVAPGTWLDAENTAERLIVADPILALEALLAALPGEDRVSAWAAAWSRASAVASSQVESIVAQSGALSDAPAEPAAIRACVDAVPADGFFVLGNSLPVREVDLWCGAVEFGVLHQRGLSGIDGLVAGAVGAALDGRPTLLVLGDVSLRHDIGSLELLRRAQRLVVAVLDNGGGRIFEHLPLASHPESEGVFDHWLQDGGPDLEHVARAHGLGFARPTTRTELAEVLAAGLAGGDDAPRLVEVQVPPHSARDASRELAAAIAVDLAEELAS